MTQPDTHKMYYLAILCPPEVDKDVHQFKHWMKDRFGCMAALKSPGHITLIPPFWLEETREPELIQVLESFNSDLSEMEICLDGFSHFNRRVLFVTVDENPAINELKVQTEIHFAQSFTDVIKKDERPFHPHVTIATRDMSPGDFIQSWEVFSKKNFRVAFQTHTISLLKLDPGKWNVIAEKQW